MVGNYKFRRMGLNGKNSNFLLLSPKLQWLQYSINHRILVTNTFLHKIKILENFHCNFYTTEVENLEHNFGNVNVCIMKFRKSVTGSCFMTVHHLRNRTCLFEMLKTSLQRYICNAPRYLTIYL